MWTSGCTQLAGPVAANRESLVPGLHPRNHLRLEASVALLQLQVGAVHEMDGSNLTSRWTIAGTCLCTVSPYGRPALSNLGTYTTIVGSRALGRHASRQRGADKRNRRRGENQMKIKIKTNQSIDRSINQESE